MSSPSSAPLLPAGDHPVSRRMVIVGCTARKASAQGPVRALELYNGGCVPSLRARLGGEPRLRARVRFLSAEHGLVTADTPLYPYDRPLDPDRAVELRPAVTAALAREMSTDGVPHEVLVGGRAAVSGAAGRPARTARTTPPALDTRPGTRLGPGPRGARPVGMVISDRLTC